MNERTSLIGISTNCGKRISLSPSYPTPSHPPPGARERRGGYFHRYSLSRARECPAYKSARASAQISRDCAFPAYRWRWVHLGVRKIKRVLLDRINRERTFTLPSPILFPSFGSSTPCPHLWNNTGDPMAINRFLYVCDSLKSSSRSFNVGFVCTVCSLTLSRHEGRRDC